MNNRQREDLDRHLTGHYGEDSVPDEGMNLDRYAKERAVEALTNEFALVAAITQAIKEAYTQGAADQKRGAVAALSNVPRRGSATSVVALITYRDAIKAVQASQPESDRGAGEGKA